MTLEIIQLPVWQDNYIYLIHEPQARVTAVVDPAEAAAPMKAAGERGWTIDMILNTHHHFDHVGGNKEIKAATGCTIFGPAGEAERIPLIDHEMRDGDILNFGALEASVFDVPGHTAGHIAYYFADQKALFCGDTLFAMGCGRLFEGTPRQMWSSLTKLRSLDGETRIYCAHEYTQANGNFALSVEPDNEELKARMDEVRRLRAHDQPTVPSVLAAEWATNPFLRADQPALKSALGMSGADAVEVFAHVRAAKDKF